ncbi:hypothetical protein FQA39_LY04347 [Lamprigera yunnana]|nr:hypothetical protein FQA39_LY04347 [Lamprigera yunnana]
MEHIWFEDDGMDQNLIIHFAEELAQALPLEILEENPNIIARNEDYFEITVPQYSNELFNRTFQNESSHFRSMLLYSSFLNIYLLLPKLIQFLTPFCFQMLCRIDTGDSDSFAREGDDGLVVDTELEIGRRWDGELNGVHTMPRLAVVKQTDDNIKRNYPSGCKKKKKQKAKEQKMQRFLGSLLKFTQRASSKAINDTEPPEGPKSIESPSTSYYQRVKDISNQEKGGENGIEIEKERDKEKGEEARKQ